MLHGQLLREDHVDGVWCWTASVLRLRSCVVGCTPPGGMGKITGIFGGTAKVYSFGHPWCQASFVAQNGRLSTKGGRICTCWVVG